MSYKDIDRVVLTPSKLNPPRFYPAMQIVFNASGAAKLEDISRRYMGESLALIVNGRIVFISNMRVPLTAGRVGIFDREIDTDHKAAEFIRSMGFELSMKQVEPIDEWDSVPVNELF